MAGVVTSVVAAVVLRMLARRFGIARKVGSPLSDQERALPPVGGLALALGCLVGAAYWRAQGGVVWTSQLTGLAGAAVLILLIGLIDDFVRELAPWQKLIGQSLAWLFLWQGGLVNEMIMLPAWANAAVSLIWTLAIINAVNLLDIADGLAAGVGLIAAGTFLALSLLANQLALAGLLAVVCGALLGVLILNFPRASLFLGDSGSMLVGLLLAALSVAVSYAPLGREIALLTPIMVLGLPIYDLAFVTLVRARNGRSVIKKSGDHFVFRLIRQGFSPTKAVLAMFGLCLAFSAAAIVVSRASNLVGLVTFGAVLLVVLWWAVRLAKAPAA